MEITVKIYVVEENIHVKEMEVNVLIVQLENGEKNVMLIVLIVKMNVIKKLENVLNVNLVIMEKNVIKNVILIV